MKNDLRRSARILERQSQNILRISDEEQENSTTSSLSSESGREVEIGNQNNEEDNNATSNSNFNFENSSVGSIEDILNSSSSSRSSNSSSTPAPTRPTGTMTTPSTMTNPFAVDIDLSKSESIKLFKTATEGLSKEKQYNGNKENGRAFKSAAQEACNDFCWGEICTSIPVTINGTNENLNIFDDYHKLTLDDVVASAKATWTEGADTHTIDTQSIEAVTIQRRIRSSMMAKWIKKSLNDDGMLTLKVHKDENEFKDSKGAIECDGPVMLRVLLEDIEPAVRVGAQDLIDKLETMSLEDHDNNLKAFLIDYQDTYKEILLKEEDYKNVVPLLLDHLLLHPDEEFRTAMQKKRDKHDEGKVYTMKEIVRLATSKFNNIDSRNKRRSKREKASTTKSGNEDTMIALVSRLENLEKKAYSFGGPNVGNYSGGGSRTTNHTVEEWRMKRDGDRKVVGGKEYFWCPHHRLEGVFDGLYMQHKPGRGHEEWQERKDRMKQAKKRTGTSGGANVNVTNNDSGDKRLVLDDKMVKAKQALVTDHGFSELQADLYFQEHLSGN